MRRTLVSGPMRRILVTGPSAVGKTYVMQNIRANLSKKFKLCDTDTFWSAEDITAFRKLDGTEGDAFFTSIINKGMDKFEEKYPDNNYIYFGLLDSGYETFSKFDKVYVLLPDAHTHAKCYLQKTMHSLFIFPVFSSFGDADGITWTAIPPKPVPFEHVNSWLSKDDFILHRKEFEKWAIHNNFPVLDQDKLTQELCSF